MLVTQIGKLLSSGSLADAGSHGAAGVLTEWSAYRGVVSLYETPHGAAEIGISRGDVSVP